MAALANGPAAEEIKKMNDGLMAKITEVLKPDQQAAFKKFQNDEIKKAGGFGALKIAMEEAGAPLTAEQEPQIQGFYNAERPDFAANWTLRRRKKLSFPKNFRTPRNAQFSLRKKKNNGAKPCEKPVPAGQVCVGQCSR